MILEIAIGVALGIVVAWFVISAIGATRRRRHQEAERRAARLREMEEEAQRREEDRLYWEQRENDKAARISKAESVLHSEQVKLIATGLRAKARNTILEEEPVYDENWLVIRFYERLICALWGRQYVDYGVESVSELIAEHQAELIRDGILEGDVSTTTAGLYVSNVGGLTGVARAALSHPPAVKQSDDWWNEYVDRTSRSGVPAEAVNLWQDLSAEVLTAHAQQSAPADGQPATRPARG